MEAILPTPLLSISFCSASKNSLPLAGGVSLPSKKQCTYTSSMPFFFAISKSPYKWVMWLCTPPSERSPMQCSAEWFFLQFSIAFKSAGFSKKSPSWISLVIRVSSWYTIRPAPIFICPTSELPICPSGSPTAIPLASPFTKGFSAISLSMTGVSDMAMALPFLLSFRP